MDYKKYSYQEKVELSKEENSRTQLFHRTENLISLGLNFNSQSVNVHTVLIKTLVIVEQVHIIPKVKLKDRIFHIIFQINDLENNRLRMSPNNAKLTDHLIPVLSQFIQTVSMYVIHDAESSRSMHISATSNQKLYYIMYSKICPWLVQ